VVDATKLKQGNPNRTINPSALLVDTRVFPTAFKGGVRVAAGDINRDGRIDIVAGQGPGGSSRGRVFEVPTVAAIGDFRAFNKSFDGGVFVGTGNIKGFAFDDIIIGQGPGGRSQVKVFSNRMAMMMPHAKDLNLSLVASFRAYRPRYQGGVRVTSLHDS